RRIFDPSHTLFEAHLQSLNTFISISALVLGAAQLIFFANFFYSLFRGRSSGRNPWLSNTLEWTAPSPPPHGNFATTPVVYRGPYEYSLPDFQEDYLPQTQSPDGVPAGPAVPVHH